MTQTSLKIGDRIKTHKGESGVIIREAEYWMQYDWWVEINFVDNGKEYVTMEPYRTEELALTGDSE